jgi:hypothetical protein
MSTTVGKPYKPNLSGMRNVAEAVCADFLRVCTIHTRSTAWSEACLVN